MTHLSGDKVIDDLFLDPIPEVDEDKNYMEFEQWFEEQDPITPEELDAMYEQMMKDFGKAMENSQVGRNKITVQKDS